MSSIRFGEFDVNEETLELRKNGIPARLQQQPARVLLFLLNRPGALVTREQLRRAIWGDETFVDFEQGLNFCIRQIRLALGDQADHPRYIETVPRLGYRCIASVESAADRQPAPEEKRIRMAIAPIEDLSGQRENYFAAGLTEDMISALSRIDPQRLRIVALPRLESMNGSDDADRLQRHFQLDYLLRGSVRRSAERIRISAQLHDLRDQSVLWSETYDRKSGDLLALQEEVTEHVSQSLSLQLFRGAHIGSRRYARSPAAYDAYLKGRFFWHKMTAGAIERSIGYFTDALALDPEFAPAYAGLADCYAQMGSVRVALMKPLEAVAKARSFLQKALELDGMLADAHCTLGLIKSWYDLDWNGAEREFQIALDLDPRHITALLWQSLYLAAVERHAEAISSVRRAREIEPLSVSVNLYLGVAHALAGQHDLAVRQIQQCIELDPSYYRSRMFQGTSLVFLGRKEEAVAELRRACELAPDSLESIAFLGVAMAAAGDRQSALKLVGQLRTAQDRTEPAVLMALIYAQLGLADEFFTCLDEAAAAKSTPIYIATITDVTRPFRADPRFQRFLASVGLPHRTQV